MKIVRRRVIIREYDYNKLVKLAIPEYYTTSEFNPIVLQELERDHMFDVLKTGDARLVKRINRIDGMKPIVYSHPQSVLNYFANHLYSTDYIRWLAEYDEHGFMWIQARKNTPRTKLGWGIFEYNY